MTRTKIDPKVKAQNALAVAQRKRDKLLAKHADLTAQARAIELQLDAVFAEVGYLAQHPLLQEIPGQTAIAVEQRDEPPVQT